jgi:hypothetical protein
MVPNPIDGMMKRMVWMLEKSAAWVLNCDPLGTAINFRK